MFSWIKKYIKEYADIKYLAYHDALTGLYNRHYLNVVKNGVYKYVYFIDLNNLKDFNKLGHTSGDKQILKCVRYIQSTYIIETDCFFRYAGDEFIILSIEPKTIKSNKMYTVGVSRIFGSIKYSINMADKDMILNKKNKVK